jgi:hypothetical protein
MPQKKSTRSGPLPEELKDEIKAMAETIYAQRQAKNLPGDELSDWLAAEAKVKAKHKL